MNSKKPKTERSRDSINYGLYCINIFGSGLNTIKDEFKRQVQTGLRQSLFILDVDELQQELENQKLITKETFNIYLINLILRKIQIFRQEYESINQKINEELKFDLYEYWKKDLNQITDKSYEKINKISDTKTLKGVNGIKDVKKLKQEIACNSHLIDGIHNTVGRESKLSQRKYIKDEPTLGKLFIIILGQMGVQFYMDLLRRDQPLEAIINFMPSENNYDIMLGNNKLRNFIAETLNIINTTIYEMRQQVTLKSVGLFNHNLPIISNCLAAKYSRQIYDQLSWSIYDIDMLKQQYEKYYYKPFQIVDVEIPKSVNLSELFYKIESLSIKGLFQNTVLPLSSSDLASVASYLNNLLNTLEFVEENRDKSLLISPNYKHHSVNNQNKLFSTITKVARYDRLILDENNKLLLNMLQYNDCQQGHSIYLCCLDYNILKQFSIYPIQPKINIENVMNLILPQYVKYYANAECCCQRISELVQKYEKYQIQEISPNYKLYTFKKFYYYLNIEEGSIIIPTRLCFRDFSLYQMEEFLKNLRESKINANSSSNNTFNDGTEKTLKLDNNIFMRPNSLKAINQHHENGYEESSNRKNNSRQSQRKKNPLMATTYFQNVESEGLPTDHNLLKGYNLEDTLQEVKYKISKYNFYQGFIQLYEERWCFQDMNKQLTLGLHNVKIFFNKPRKQLQGISSNIRLITDSNINIRILNQNQECSKIVMNYSNGLSIFHHNTFCEQIWYGDQTVGNEQRRIFTPFGAIIVYFKSNELIMIMRYNGEVYKLYQHELKTEEEEEEEDEKTQDFKTHLLDIQEKSSEYIDIKAQGDSALLNSHTKKYKHFQNLKSINNSEVSIKKSKQSSDEFIKLSKSTSVTNNLKSLINYELNFLNQICSLYKLSYLHLIITTSQGKCLNLTPHGEIYEDRDCFTREWHDYYANELYSERSDGVKMIWSQDCFKCIHSDGSVFKTIVEEDISIAEDKELESQISQSSSHNEYKGEIEEEKPMSKDFLAYNNINLKKSSSDLDNSAYTYKGVSEECISQDIPIISYEFKSWFMQHPNYAKVYILNTRNSNMPVAMEIFGIDNIRIYCHTEFCKGLKNFDFDSVRMEDEEYEQNYLDFNLIVNVWFGQNLHVKCDQEACEVYAVIHRTTTEKELQSDSLTLSFKYTDDINYIFKYLLNEIASLENYNGKNKKELYFIEQKNSDDSIRGFEFFHTLPQLSQYNYRVNNNITELKTIKTIQELMTNNDMEYIKDLNKFPQFKTEEKDNLRNTEITLPLILTANIFLEVPKHLRSVTNITKFLEPFENIHFKQLRCKFKNVLNYILKPQQLYDLKKYSSTKNWKKRHLEHESRLFNEQQRLGLYYAMNKYKIYPNYWKFTQTYKGQVRRIEFFDFMQNKCNNKEVEK